MTHVEAMKMVAGWAISDYVENIDAITAMGEIMTPLLLLELLQIAYARGVAKRAGDFVASAESSVKWANGLTAMLIDFRDPGKMVQP